MTLRIIGASCILIVCGGFGFMLAEKYMRQARSLRQLIGALDYMESELLFRLPQLPILCRQVAEQIPGGLAQVFSEFAKELESQISPNVDLCMHAALGKVRDLPEMTKYALIQLGAQLGKFDLSGQVKGLEMIRQFCHRKLTELEQNKDNHIRGYKTLGLCAGAALVILFL